MRSHSNRPSCNWHAIETPERLLQLIDIARRAGESETATEILEEFNKCEVEEPLLKKNALFQGILLKNNDTSCYRVEDV